MATLSFCLMWNYLRVRGEYCPTPFTGFCTVELPPRARRIPGASGIYASPPGTTSACAENTLPQQLAGSRGGNYLRVRGEYWRRCRQRQINWELPPRARRIHWGDNAESITERTTSACAENTLAWGELTQAAGNYLRVRGEYRVWLRINDARAELPPRARRILIIAHALLLFLGTTSACAENTIHCIRFGYRGWNYLRVRGEYQPQPRPDQYRRELPPRARRIPLLWCGAWQKSGTTSACAENTMRSKKSLTWSGNYLRVRGEYPK